MDPSVLFRDLHLSGRPSRARQGAALRLSNPSLSQNLSSLGTEGYVASQAMNWHSGDTVDAAADWLEAGDFAAIHAWEEDRLRSILKDFHSSGRSSTGLAGLIKEECLTPKAVRAVRKFGGSQKLESWIRRHSQTELASSGSAKAILDYKQHIVDSSMQGLTVGVATLFLVYQSPECEEAALRFYGRTVCWVFGVVYFVVVYMSVAMLLVFTYKCIYMFLGAPFGDALSSDRQIRLLMHSDIRTLSLKLRSSLLFLGTAIPLGVAMTTKPVFALIALVVSVMSALHVRRWQRDMEYKYAEELLQEARNRIELSDSRASEQGRDKLSRPPSVGSPGAGAGPKKDGVRERSLSRRPSGSGLHFVTGGGPSLDSSQSSNEG